MSTKAEIQRLKARRKKLNTIAKVVGCIALIVLGIAYCIGLSDGKDDNGMEGASTPVEKNETDAKVKTFDLGDNSSTKAILPTSEPTEGVAGDATDGDDGSTKVDDGSSIGMSDGPSDNSTDGTVDGTPVQSPGIGKDGRVNINTASVSELCTLNGIGEKRAKDIVEYRETHGYFKDIEDIMKVKGIKQGIFSKIRDKITCE